ncbi:hypothetical protein EWM64_g1678 [Hericium alpestre]|uniref:Uncharacterized protein n=1 Tax=Hericium alpestre TaxID=135208 RepID=A0A4Z0A7L9_9AGAM|nr:hypothetical protein EWM64_g1678 [Hericium alpestre]
MFGETSDLQAEKRGNFVVVGCVDGPKVRIMVFKCSQ